MPKKKIIRVLSPINSSNVLDRDSLLLKELYKWLPYPNDLKTGSDLKKYDMIIKSSSDTRPTILGIERSLKLQYKNQGEYFEYGGNHVCVYQPLTEKIIKKRDLTQLEIKQYGFYHHQILHNLYHLVKDRFSEFSTLVTTLNSGMEIEKWNDSHVVFQFLSKSVDHLSKRYKKHVGILIPDLFTFSPDTSLMSNDHKWIKQNLVVPDLSTCYTYAFSSQTSMAFSNLIRKLFLKEQEFLRQTLNLPLDKVKKVRNKFSAQKFPDSLSKYSAIMEILGLEEDVYIKNPAGRNERIRRDGELIVLLVAMIKMRIIPQNYDRNLIALYSSLITGKSSSTMYDKIPPKSGKLCVDKVFPGQNKDVMILNLRKFKDRLSESIEKMIIDIQ